MRLLKCIRRLDQGFLNQLMRRACVTLSKRGLQCARQVSVDIVYDELHVSAGLRIDVVVADVVIIELKAVEEMKPLFQAQLLTYLKLTGKRLGFLINFNSVLFKQGVKRMSL